MTARFPAPWLMAFTAATLLAVPALMLWVDEPLARFFHTYADSQWVGFFAAITDLASGYIWYSFAVLGLVIAYTRREAPDAPAGPEAWNQRRRAWMFMIAAMASSGIAEVAIKFAIGRDRPRFLFSEAGASFHPFRLNTGDSSFPSGHTQSICAAMLSLALIYPPLRPLFLVTAVLISASRVIIGAHYAADVAGGLWLAVVAVSYWRWRFEAGGVPLDLTSPPAPSASAPPPAPSN